MICIIIKWDNNRKIYHKEYNCEKKKFKNNPPISEKLREYYKEYKSPYRLFENQMKDGPLGEEVYKEVLMQVVKKLNINKPVTFYF